MDFALIYDPINEQFVSFDEWKKKKLTLDNMYFRCHCDKWTLISDGIIIENEESPHVMPICINCFSNLNIKKRKQGDNK